METNKYSKQISLTDFGAESEDIARRRKMAEMLQQQSMAPIEREPMAGGYVVPTSWTHGLAKLLQGGLAGYQQKQLKGEGKDLARRLREQTSQDVSNFTSALQGTPASAESWTGEAGDELYNPAKPAVAGNKQKALGIALGSESPILSGAGQNMLSEMMKTPVSPWAKIDPKDYTAQSVAQFAATQNPALLVPVRKQESVTGLAGANGPETRFIDPYNPPTQPMQQAVKNDMVPLGNVVQPVNPYAQTSQLNVGVSPNTSYAQGEENKRFGSVSGNTAATTATTRRGQDMGVDPNLQGPLAQARAIGTTTGTGTAQAAMELPKAIATASQSLNLIDQMIGDLNVGSNGKITSGKVKPHPGFSVGVGASMQPGFQYIPGTDKASFYALKDQVLGGAFMAAYDTLKGGGQITEIEGQKGTTAITRMNTAQSEAEFVKAAREFQSVIKGGVERAKLKASGIPQRRSSDGAGRVIDFGALPK